MKAKLAIVFAVLSGSGNLDETAPRPKLAALTADGKLDNGWVKDASRVR